MKRLRDLVVGDDVWSVIRGKGKVVDLDMDDSNYTIGIIFDDDSTGSTVWYTKGGKFRIGDKFPEIHTTPIKIVPVEIEYQVAYKLLGCYPEITTYYHKSIQEFKDSLSPAVTLEWAELLEKTRRIVDRGDV